jgi:beta-N-acetylhexosaminidase
MPAHAFLAALALISITFATISRERPTGPQPTVPQPTVEHVAARQAASAPGGVSPTPTPPQVATTKLLGQRIMVGMDGTSAPPWLLTAVRQGRVGSVILFAANIVSRSQLRALTGSLQRAAHGGGNPPLLIAVDQEGGQVKRLPAGPPHLSPPQIARTGSVAVASQEGSATGSYLKDLGINMDLAPVVDVPTFPGAFVWTQGRAFSFNPSTVAKYATAFALGIQGARVAATAKHFPGVGSAGVDTDNKLDVLRPTKAQLAGALIPYRSLIPRGIDAIMLSTAAFPAYDPSRTPTALSRRIVGQLLRGTLHFGGVTITDALGTPTGHDEITAGTIAARAGADILLYTDSAPGELSALQTELRSGRLSLREAQASYSRILALKRRIGAG